MGSQDFYDRITKRLEEFYTVEEAGIWWRKPHPQLDGLPAISLMNSEEGQAAIVAVLDRLESDAYL